MATVAQVIESAQGTELIASLENFIQNMAEYEGGTTHPAMSLYERVDKLVGDLRALEVDGVPATFSSPD